jgi:small-conductance mechanosensitive channel/CRP-like cAMP-binding protein
MASSTAAAPTTATALVPSAPTHLPVTAGTLLDASLYAGLAVLFFAIALLLPPERRRGLIGSALLAIIVLLGLWLFAQVGDAIGSATLYEIIREALLALLAFAVIRSTLIFITRVLLMRFQVPHILTDVLLTLGLLVYMLYRLNVIGVNLAGILTTSAVITGAIAFSAQEILGALWAGLALQGERTLRQGDWIRFNDKLGQVVQLRWRSTAIATCDHETIIIPNAALMKDKIQLVGRHGDESSNQRRHIPFSVSYSNAPNDVIRIVNHALQRAAIHNVAKEPAPFCVCKAFEESGIGYEVLYHIQDLHHYTETDSAVLAHIFAALQREEMTIPFPHRVVQSLDQTLERQERRESQRRHAIIDQIPLFAPLNDAERETLARALQACPFVADDLLFRQGEPADSLYVLASGHLQVFHEDANGERHPLAELRAPSYVGERGLLLGQPRGATIVATRDSLCYRLDKNGFDAILRGRPEIVLDLSNVLVQRQAENDARLQALDAEARARQSSSHAAEFVRMIRGFFGLGGGTGAPPA